MDETESPDKIVEGSEEESVLLEQAAMLSGVEDDEEVDSPQGDTPFRAWLLTLLRFCVGDHLRSRLGWRTVRGSGQGPSKRDLATGAGALSDVDPESARPPVTDYLTVKAFVEEAQISVRGRRGGGRSRAEGGRSPGRG